MSFILDLLFPKRCLGCKGPGGYLCSPCLNKVKQPRYNPYALSKFGVKRLVHIFAYEGIIRQAIIAFKYKYATKVGEELSQYTYLFLKKQKIKLPRKAVLVPIPLYWLKGNRRGFNQCVEIGGYLAGKLGWDFCPDLLIKTKAGKSQTELTREKRTRGQKGTLAFNPKYKNNPKKTIVLFDDVYTTGSTIKEAAWVLRENGAKDIWGLTIAKTSWR